MTSDRRRHAPATDRNRMAIATVLARELPESGLVLEIAAGSGEHAIYFAGEFPGLQWLPSDVDTGALDSIQTWSKDTDLRNIKEPVLLDAAADYWPVERADAMFCCNMIHISGLDATEGLFQGAGRILDQGDPLIVYGPFLEKDVETAPSNLAFDNWLKKRNSDWGLRSLEKIDELAENHGLRRASRVEMPANNLTLTYRRV